MPRALKVNRKPGVILKDAAYDRNDLADKGLGDETLMQARQSGLVKPRMVGQKLMYMGSELLTWIESLPAKTK